MSDDTAALRAEIEQTREQLGRDVALLGETISPKHQAAVLGRTAKAQAGQRRTQVIAGVVLVVLVLVVKRRRS